MRVDAARLAAWRSEVALAAADAELHAAAELESWAAAHPGRTVEEAREAAIATASRASSAYGRVSAASSGRLFDELAEAQGHGARFEVVDTTDAAYTEEAARKLANRLRDGDEDGFRRGVSQLVGNQVRRNSQASMAANCERTGVRWARVPSGQKPCDWCLMLASRGFVYKSKASAGGLSQWHRGCMCAIVPDFDGSTAIQGYDPDALYDEWKARKGAGKSLPFVSREKGARPLPKEEYIAGIIASEDAPVWFMKDVNINGMKTPDAYVGDAIWEFKVPEKWNDKTVKNQFKKAIGKGTPNLLISGTENGTTIADMEPKVLEVFASEEYPQIKRVWLLDREGGSKIIEREK